MFTACWVGRFIKCCVFGGCAQGISSAPFLSSSWRMPSSLMIATDQENILHEPVLEGGA
jgi:hypothetical protein